MYQLLKMNKPIPSCSIFKLEYNESNNEWNYVYALETPFKLTNDNKKEMIIYEYISDLRIETADFVHEDSVNIRFTTLDEYIGWLEKQRIEDLAYREIWKAKNPDVQPNTITLQNKDYTQEELLNAGLHFIAGIFNKTNEETIFIGV